nr:class F sortase [Pseudonocardia asaccharolytica]
MLPTLGLATMLVVGCGQPEPPAPPSHPVAPVEVADPVAVTIPAIGAHSSLIPLGVDPDGAAEVPPVHTPEQAGWYEPGPEPGQPGPAVLLGHVNGAGRPGIFARLHELRPGDDVTVDRADHTSITYRITRVEQLPKHDFPTAAVFGDQPETVIRLVTCGGTFDRTAGSYIDSVIAYGEAT